MFKETPFLINPLLQMCAKIKADNVNVHVYPHVAIAKLGAGNIISKAFGQLPLENFVAILQKRPIWAFLQNLFHEKNYVYCKNYKTKKAQI